MSGLAKVAFDDIISKGSVTDADVAEIRRAFFQDGAVSADEADFLFLVNDVATVKCAGWRALFVEAITDYIVTQAQPQGYITAHNAAWLMERVSKDGVVDTSSELELIVSVLDKARWSPVSLVKFALEQVKHAVVDGIGPSREAGTGRAGSITDAEVDLLRRILYAFGGDGHVAVTRDEAEVLFDIDEAIEQSPPNAAWTDLFVKAVANVIMSTSGYRVPTREEALRREASLQSPEQQTSVMAFLLAMVQSNMATVKDAYHDQTAEERALAKLEHQRIEIITNEEITEAEAGWLAARLGRDGRLSPSETALVTFLKTESPHIHPILLEAVDRLGTAA